MRYRSLGFPLTDDRLRMEQGRIQARIRKFDRKVRSAQRTRLVAVAVLDLIVVERVLVADGAVRAVLEEAGARGDRARRALRTVDKDELSERVAKMSPGAGIILPERRGVREDVS